MCDATCIKEPFVQRGTVVLDCGVFVQNYAGCSACGSRAAPASSPPRCESEEDEDEIAEETEFDHRCADCGHLVATHWHRFVSGDLARRWSMACALCGRGADERASLSAHARARGDADQGSTPPPPPEALSPATMAAATDALLARTAALGPARAGVGDDDDDDDDEWT